MSWISGKVAIVTGGGSGFGAGIVAKFVSEGCMVAVMDVNVSSMGGVWPRPNLIWYSTQQVKVPSIRCVTFSIKMRSNVLTY